MPFWLHCGLARQHSCRRSEPGAAGQCVAFGRAISESRIHHSGLFAKGRIGGGFDTSMFNLTRHHRRVDSDSHAGRHRIGVGLKSEPSRTGPLNTVSVNRLGVPRLFKS